MRASLGTYVVAVLLGVSAFATSSEGWSQQKFPLKETDSEGGYVQEHPIDAGDIPGHQVRTYQLKFSYPKKDLVFLGVPVKESFVAGISDYINGNGPFTTYDVFILEDGNKIYARGTGTTQSEANGARKFSYVDNFTGGTGKFKGIRGQLRGSGERAAGSKVLTESDSGEYWIEE